MKFASLRPAPIFEAENPRLREGAGFDRSSRGRVWAQKPTTLFSGGRLFFRVVGFLEAGSKVYSFGTGKKRPPRLYLHDVFSQERHMYSLGNFEVHASRL